jgi:hypothetical protein
VCTAVCTALDLHRGPVLYESLPNPVYSNSPNQLVGLTDHGREALRALSNRVDS